MSPTEFAFLALGLVLGVAVGAAVVEVVRLRPVPRREVRITVAPHSIAARRALTLNSADPDAGRLPVPGSPEAGAWVDVGPGPSPAGGTEAVEGSPDRTIVPSLPAGRPAAPVAIPVRPEAPVFDAGARLAPDRVPRRGADHDAGRPSAVAVATMPAIAERRATAFGRIEDLVSHTVADTPSTLPAGADVGDPGGGRMVRPRAPAPRPPLTLTSRSVAIPITGGHAVQRQSTQAPAGDRRAAVTPLAAGEGLPPGPEPAASGPGPGGGATGPAGAPSATDACAAERRVAAERCALAEAAREQARAAAESLREAQRAYDDLREHVDRAQGLADPREIRAAKDAAHRAFRDARAAARDAEDAEAAARDWLHEINRINTSAREAIHVVEAGSAELRAQLPRLDRLAVEADAARIAADSAQAGCRDAQEALARCEEQALAATKPPLAEEEPAPQVPGWPAEPEAVLRAPASDEEDFSRLPLVLRVLRGDRPARERLVATLAGSDPEAGRVWRMRLAELLDAIVARAIEDGFLDFPEEHPFWGMFGNAERRDIVGALSALGFRFDGLGAFADARVPAQRDLSLAVGYAGLDRMRIRRWPHEEELAGLYREATVAAGEWLAAEAGDLSLGRMVDALGSRAGELADVWNAWGRVRPALLATD